MALPAWMLRPRASGRNLDPRSVGPLHCWFDAADSATIFDANTGGSLPAAGGAIGRINDKSGNERHATQGTANNRPTYQVGVQGGLPVMRFDGSNDVLVTPSFSTSANLTAFVVVKANNWHRGVTQGLMAHAYAAPVPGDKQGVVIGAVVANVFADWTANDYLSFGNGYNAGRNPRAVGPASSGSAFRLFCTQLGSQRSRVFVNSQAASTRVEGTASIPIRSGAASIGATSTGGIESWAGDIAEVLYYSTDLTLAGIGAVSNYLNYKWKIY